MAQTREELRERLLAALDAAPELPREDRHFLADGFLDELETHFRLAARPRGRVADGVAGARFAATQIGRGLPPLWLLVPAALLLLPFVIVPLFVLAHVPFLVLILAFLFLARAMGHGPRRRRLPPAGRGHWAGKYPGWPGHDHTTYV